MLKERFRVFLVVLFGVAIFGGIFYYHIWRIQEFSKATGMGFWKAFFVMGK